MKLNKTTGWLKYQRVIKSPNYDKRPQKEEVTLLVIHSISLPPGGYLEENNKDYVTEFFCNKLNKCDHPYFEEIHEIKVSSHFYIRRCGQLTQFVSTLDRAWHAGVSSFKGRECCNDFSIGIELEGSDTDVFTDNQYATLINLTKELTNHYPKISKQTTTGHSDIAPGRKTDPGRGFDWSRYLNAAYKA